MKASCNLRYGKGLYFSRTSSKSNDYLWGEHKVLADGSRWGIMFLCKVALGRSWMVAQDFVPEDEVGRASRFSWALVPVPTYGIIWITLTVALPCLRC